MPVHAVMPPGWSSPVGRVLSRSGLGVLTALIPPRLVDEALTWTDRGEQRWRALPARLGVYFVLALCLLRTQSHTSVIRAMIPIDRLIRLRALGWTMPTSTALTKMRDRIGVAPLRVLFEQVTRLTPTPRRPWSHAFGLLVCALDGTEITLPATDTNAQRFPPHRGKNGECGAPKIRLMVLLACGTRQIITAVTGTLGQGEVTLAHRLAPNLRAGMLLLADRAFLGYRLWTTMAATGAQLLWRAKKIPHLPVEMVLSDGSFLSRLTDPRDARRWRKNASRNRKRGHRPHPPRRLDGVTVRVIDAIITIDTGHTTRMQRYRLVTTLLDPTVAPAHDLVALYARRWVVETGIGEIKTILLAGRGLRGHTPIRACQELWATLIVYQALRLLACQAALADGLDPSRISFTATRDTATRMITTTPGQAVEHTEHACQDLRRQLVSTHTTCRVYPRTVTKTPTRYPYRSKTRQLTSTNAHYRAHILPASPPTPTTPPTPTPAQPRAA